jgi:hypothetical protein
MEGVGPITADVFEAAGYTTVWQVCNFFFDNRAAWNAQLRAAFEKLSATERFAGMDRSYWERMRSRCTNIAYRARSANAANYVPHEFMCPLSLDWYDDPVITPSGHSYSREWILEHITRLPNDPVTGAPLTAEMLYDNIALRAAVDHCRMH